MEPDRTGPVFASTLTHARVRAGQGDVQGARRILRAILDCDPQHAEALRMLLELQDRRQHSRREAPAAPVSPPRSARAGELTASFRRSLGATGAEAARVRIRRLERWLRSIERRHGLDG
jgi:hypothetical protein